MRTSELFVPKNLGFFEICGVSSRARGVEPVQLRTSVESKIFTILCERLLWKALNPDCVTDRRITVNLLLSYCGTFQAGIYDFKSPP